MRGQIGKEPTLFHVIVKLKAFLGHDSVAVTFAIFLNDIAQNPEVQERLRQEISNKQAEIGGDDATFTPYDYESMPYLNAVLKESMRLNPILSESYRTNRADDVLPLSEPIQGTDGKVYNELTVSKGTIVVVDVTSTNRRKDLWGEDADQFNPERWLKEGEKAVPLAKAPGVVFGAMLSFMAGNRTCPGWRIAVLELQIFICDIMQDFRIKPVEGVSIEREFHVVGIPKVAGKPVKGGEVPIILEVL
ncbi:hypothetical protein M422DRAFT_261592 [Sphaerobolus stellatus SS14]|uniref:Cytochrome P450 n=1 Tax=Sphaerobolus stellatus (strain SS14) TaxID=990650 RepID=A0A0C9U035_SPHS4|nr:hypothetical protein M422DRAFT_261592 [Sphaerobolus stellatus SS14]